MNNADELSLTALIPGRPLLPEMKPFLQAIGNKQKDPVNACTECGGQSTKYFQAEGFSMPVTRIECTRCLGTLVTLTDEETLWVKEMYFEYYVPVHWSLAP